MQIDYVLSCLVYDLWVNRMPIVNKPISYISDYSLLWDILKEVYYDISQWKLITTSLENVYFRS